VTVRKKLPNGRYIELEEYLYGFKVVVIYEVRLRLIVAAQVAPIHRHDTNFTLDLLDQAMANVGLGVIQVLVLDRGFLDGETLWAIKQRYGVDLIIPSKDDMGVTAEARAFRRHKTADEDLVWAQRPAEGDQWAGQVRLYGVKTVTAFDQLAGGPTLDHSRYLRLALLD
jgi:hypothetical protein